MIAPPTSVAASHALGFAPSHRSEPLSYTPQHLAEKILTSCSALEGERKQVTVLFVDLKGSTELIRDLDPEQAQALLDPALHAMMEAVHRYEGTVNQVLGDDIMALFGAPMAHEDHAARACYAALAMQDALRCYADEVRRTHGLTVQVRVGLNAGEVVVRAIAECSEEALHHSLTQLQGAGFLYETRLFPEREYTFKHALTHEVAYGSLLQEATADAPCPHR